MLRRARFKTQRRLGVELPGLGKAGALERRPYPPGESGNKRKKYSDYALRLEEKQKLRYHYVLKERQLRRFIRNAKTGKSSHWVNKLISLLEKRLDNVIFRMSFAPSIPSARQLISHGHVLVEGKKTNIPSFVLKQNQTVSIKEKSQKNQIILQGLQNPRLEMPDYLRKEEKQGQIIGVLQAEPNVEHIPFAFNIGLFTEYYAARKA
ncbi:MAG: 30S ribosomal protein S4 [Bdellovibrionaceae bacterium]|nr:30S ribosomal protein S4 [Pseudobdellovibrionaceae bacterium]